MSKYVHTKAVSYDRDPSLACSLVLALVLLTVGGAFGIYPQAMSEEKNTAAGCGHLSARPEIQRYREFPAGVSSGSKIVFCSEGGRDRLTVIRV